MNELLHSEINKEDAQLRVHAYKSKLFSTFVVVKKNLESIYNISTKIVSVGRFTTISNICTFPQLQSHRAEFESQFHHLLAVCYRVSYSASLSFISHFYHSDNGVCLESLKNLEQFSHVTIKGCSFTKTI